MYGRDQSFFIQQFPLTNELATSNDARSSQDFGHFNLGDFFCTRVSVCADFGFRSRVANTGQG